MNTFKHLNNVPYTGDDTVGGYISCLRRFFKFCEKRGYMLYDPMADIKRPPFRKKLPKVILTEKEATKIIKTPDTSTVTGYRDRAILELLYATGIRNAELRNLAVEDVDMEGFKLRILNGKGSVDRVVPLSRTAVYVLKEYINKVRPVLKKQQKTENRNGTGGSMPGDTGTAARSQDNKEYLFLSKWGVQLTGYALRKMVLMYIKRLGFPKRVSCHTFRHAVASSLLERGMNIRCIQEFLGHKSLGSTQIYTRVTINDLKRMHKKYFPRKK